MREGEVKNKYKENNENNKDNEDKKNKKSIMYR